MLAARRLASRFQWMKNVKGIWFSGSAARRLASRCEQVCNPKKPSTLTLILTLMNAQL